MLLKKMLSGEVVNGSETCGMCGLSAEMLLRLGCFLAAPLSELAVLLSCLRTPGHGDPITASAFLPLVDLEEGERDGHLYRTPTTNS